MKYYNSQQTIDLFQKLPDSLKPFDLPQIADLCRQGILTPVFACNSYGIEVLESYDGNKRFINKNGGDPEPDTSRFPDPKTTSLYNDYFTHDRLTSLLDKSIDKLSIRNAMTYKSDGSGYEVVLVANPLNVNKYLNDESYSIYSDDDGYTITRESLLFPSEQVQSYISSKQTAEQNTPEQQLIAKLEREIADLTEKLSQQTDKPAKTNIDEGQGDTLLILGAVMDCITEIAKPNYTQQSLITAITDKYQNTPSLSQSTLTKKFPKAKTHLKQNVTS